MCRAPSVDDTQKPTNKETIDVSRGGDTAFRDGYTYSYYVKRPSFKHRQFRCETVAMDEPKRRATQHPGQHWTDAKKMAYSGFAWLIMLNINNIVNCLPLSSYEIQRSYMGVHEAVPKTNVLREIW